MKDLNYPLKFDDDSTLLRVYDSLRVPLGRDYTPGDSIISASEDISKFPDNGIITIVDNCSDVKATSFYYDGKDNNTFYGLRLLNGTIDGFKNKKTSIITQQVMAEYHNIIKDSIINIQKVIGTSSDDITKPSIYARINRLHELIYKPKAWFEASNTKGIVPFKVIFTDKSNGTKGPVGEVLYTWYLGEEEVHVTTIPSIEKTYEIPGKYTVGLKIENEYGNDFIEFENMIEVMLKAPAEADIQFILEGDQILKDDGTLRTPANQVVNIEIPDKKTKKKTFAGEHIDKEGNVLDVIKTYDWNLSDGLVHENSAVARALYSIGGIHDVTVKATTDYGSFRITTKKNAIDVIEQENLWLWNFNDENNISSYEFGLVSEFFKSKSISNKNLNINSSFLNNKKSIQEFKRTNGFARRSNMSSGSQGTCVLYWASGRSPNESSNNEKINFCEYNAFTETYFTPFEGLNKTWNWASFNTPNSIYFFLDPENPTLKTSVNLANYDKINHNMQRYNFLNGSYDLVNSKTDFSIYRTTWIDNKGFIATGNVKDGIKNFYKTEGNISNPFININKLNDFPIVKKNGQLVTLNSKVYFFDNSDSVLCYNDLNGTWRTIGPINKFNGTETLLACSDGYSNIYLSFENNKFFKFNEQTELIKTLSDRPSGEQWLMNIF